jgi:hypothetical protein
MNRTLYVNVSAAADNGENWFEKTVAAIEEATGATNRSDLEDAHPHWEEGYTAGIYELDGVCYIARIDPSYSGTETKIDVEPLALPDAVMVTGPRNDDYGYGTGVVPLAQAEKLEGVDADDDGGIWGKLEKLEWDFSFNEEYLKEKGLLRGMTTAGGVLSIKNV